MDLRQKRGKVTITKELFDSMVIDGHHNFINDLPMLITYVEYDVPNNFVVYTGVSEQFDTLPEGSKAANYSYDFIQGKFMRNHYE